MLQEPNAETGAFCRAFDESRDVGHHETLERSDRDHAELRVQRRERVVRDLRPGGGYCADQRRLTGPCLPGQEQVLAPGEQRQRVFELLGEDDLAFGGCPGC